MKRTPLLFLLLMISLFLSSCESDEIFGDYSLTYSYNSNTSQTVSSSSDSESEAKNNSGLVNASSGHRILSFVNSVKPGEKASIKIEGVPETEYSIAVFYSSGQSKSKDLLPKTSDAQGIVSWEWRVGINTSQGNYSVIISAEGETVIKTEINVLSKEQ